MNKKEKTLREKMKRLSRYYEEIYILYHDIGIQNLGRTEDKLFRTWRAQKNQI